MYIRREGGKYTWERFLGDCAGGMIAALIALPYGLSMAALMGLPPILGVVTSILTAPITALLGRNPVLIGGTASATVPFIASAVRAQGIGGAAKVSIVASVLMMAFCVLRLGRFVSKVPASVVAGFSAGIGGIMLISQLHVLAGVHAPAGDNDLVKLFGFLDRAARSALGAAGARRFGDGGGGALHQVGAAHTRSADWRWVLGADCGYVPHSRA